MSIVAYMALSVASRAATNTTLYSPSATHLNRGPSRRCSGGWIGVSERAHRGVS